MPTGGARRRRRRVGSGCRHSGGPSFASSHDAHNKQAEIPRWLSLAVIMTIFVISYVYARLQGPVEEVDALTKRAEEMLDPHSR